MPPFYQKVLSEVKKIPYGEVRTYQEIAAKAGNPRAYRAAGSANAKNILPIIIPCHRVIGNDGNLGGYGGGLKIKKYLFLIILAFFVTLNLFSKDYLINLQAKVVSSDKHNYSEGNNFNLIKLDGSFTDNLGNYGNWNALASFELNNNKIKQHFFSAEIIYQNESKMYIQGSRNSREFE